jgi:hypothetical protein
MVTYAGCADAGKLLAFRQDGDGLDDPQGDSPPCRWTIRVVRCPTSGSGRRGRCACVLACGSVSLSPAADRCRRDRLVGCFGGSHVLRPSQLWVAGKGGWAGRSACDCRGRERRVRDACCRVDDPLGHSGLGALSPSAGPRAFLDRSCLVALADALLVQETLPVKVAYAPLAPDVDGLHLPLTMEGTKARPELL